MSRFTTSAVLLLLTSPVVAQPVIIDVAPQSASPGDEITVRGTFPIGLTHIQFTANVGGFLGVDVRNVAITGGTATAVKVTVPTMAGFAPPNATPPGAPMGTLRARNAGGQFSQPFTFYYHQGSYLDPAGQTPLLATIGLGSTNSTGCRAATSFTVANGPPNLPGGNPNFEVTLENTPPNSPAFLVIGVPAMSSMLPIGDGFVGIDLSSPFNILPLNFVTDGSGKAMASLPTPSGPLGIPSITAGWGYTDATTGQLHASNGMTANL